MEFWTRTIIANSGLLLEGLRLTLSVSAIAFLVAAVAGLSICLARIYLPPLRPILAAYIAFCRNTPIFVQLLWVAYAWYDIFAWPNDVFTAAWVALALQSSGYLAETFRAGLESVPHGQVEAAHALGVGRFTTLRRIVAPQMLLTIAPSLMKSVHRHHEMFDAGLRDRGTRPHVPGHPPHQSMGRTGADPHPRCGDLHRPDHVAVCRVEETHRPGSRAIGDLTKCWEACCDNRRRLG